MIHLAFKLAVLQHIKKFNSLINPIFAEFEKLKSDNKLTDINITNALWIKNFKPKFDSVMELSKTEYCTLYKAFKNI